MKALTLLIIAIVCLNFISCKNTHAFDKYVKELDSLKVVVQQSVANFKTVDSLTCVTAAAKQYTYAQFIETHLKDTVSKSVVENLQDFQSVKQGLNDYLAYRSDWLAQANACVIQLQNLSHDLKNGSISEEEAIEFKKKKKKQAENSIEGLKINTEVIRKHLEVFNQSLPVCEDLVKQLNSGVLPQLIKPEIKPSH